MMREWFPYQNMPAYHFEAAGCGVEVSWSDRLQTFHVEYWDADRPTWPDWIGLDWKEVPTPEALVEELKKRWLTVPKEIMRKLRKDYEQRTQLPTGYEPPDTTLRLKDPKYADR
jgi:hypothetical protein